MAKTFDDSDFADAVPAKTFTDDDFVQPSSWVRRNVADPAIALTKGLIGVPETVVGLADIAMSVAETPKSFIDMADTAASVLFPRSYKITSGASKDYGIVGRVVQSTGLDFKKAKTILDSMLSPEQQADDRYFRESVGFFNKVKAAVQRPAIIVQGATESAPTMLTGAALSRTVMAVAPKVAPLVAAAIGEAIVTAGQNTEQVRQESEGGGLSLKQVGTIGASSAATGLLGFMGGKAAAKLGINDVDVLLATGTGAAGKKNVARRVIDGMLSEGVLEELPQSTQEQIAQNLASGKKWDEGVADAAVQGMLSGMAMGSTANVFGGNPKTLESWASANPEAAAALAAKEAPSRKDFDAAGLPRASAQDRAATAEVLRGLDLTMPDPTAVQETPAQPLTVDGKEMKPGDTVPAGQHEIDGKTVLMSAATPVEDVQAMMQQEADASTAEFKHGLEEDSYVRDLLGKESAPFLDGSKKVFRGTGEDDVSKKKTQNGMTFFTDGLGVAKAYASRLSKNGRGTLVSGQLAGHYFDLTDQGNIYRLRTDIRKRGLGAGLTEQDVSDAVKVLESDDLYIFDTTNKKEYDSGWNAIQRYFSAPVFGEGIKGVVFLDQHFDAGGYSKTYAKFDKSPVLENKIESASPVQEAHVEPQGEVAAEPVPVAAPEAAPKKKIGRKGVKKALPAEQAVEASQPAEKESIPVASKAEAEAPAGPTAPAAERPATPAAEGKAAELMTPGKGEVGPQTEDSYRDVDPNTLPWEESARIVRDEYGWAMVQDGEEIARDQNPEELARSAMEMNAGYHIAIRATDNPNEFVVQTAEHDLEDKLFYDLMPLKKAKELTASPTAPTTPPYRDAADAQAAQEPGEAPAKNKGLKDVELWTGQRTSNSKLKRASGVFLSNNKEIARKYAGKVGAVHRVVMSTERVVPYSEALPALQSVLADRRGNWTQTDIDAFNEYAKENDIETGVDKMDGDAEYALQKAPDQTDVDKFMFLMPDSLREMGHDPNTAIVERDYEVGGGMKDGSKEYIVFGEIDTAAEQAKPAKNKGRKAKPAVASVEQGTKVATASRMQILKDQRRDVNREYNTAEAAISKLTRGSLAYDAARKEADDKLALLNSLDKQIGQTTDEKGRTPAEVERLKKIATPPVASDKPLFPAAAVKVETAPDGDLFPDAIGKMPTLDRVRERIAQADKDVADPDISEDELDKAEKRLGKLRDLAGKIETARIEEIRKGEPPKPVKSSVDPHAPLASEERTTPRRGTPERDAMEKNDKSREALQTELHAKMDALKRKQPTKHYGPTAESWKKKVDALEQQIQATYLPDEQRTLRYLAALEDQADSPNDPAHKLALKAEIASRRFKLKDLRKLWVDGNERDRALGLVRSIQTSSREGVERIAREIAMKQYGATQAEADGAAQLAAQRLMDNPAADTNWLSEHLNDEGRKRPGSVQVSVLDIRRDKMLRGARDEINTLDLPRASVTRAMSRLDGVTIWDTEKIGTILDETKAEAAALTEAKDKADALLKESQATALAERTAALVDPASVPFKVKDAWDGNRIEGGRLLSDGRSMVVLDAVSAGTAKKLSNDVEGKAKAPAARAEQLWTEATDAKTRGGEWTVLGADAEPHNHGSKLTFLMNAKGNVVAVDAHRFASLQTWTKSDALLEGEIMQGGKKFPVVLFMRNGKPVAMNTTIFAENASNLIDSKKALKQAQAGWPADEKSPAPRAEIDEGAPLPAGVGAARAANPQEFFGDAVGTKHAYTEAQRAKLGLPPRTAREAVQDEALAEQANAMTPAARRDRIAEFVADPKLVPSDLDAAIFAHEIVDAETALNDAKNDAGVESANVRLDALYSVVERAGSEAGAALRARRFMMDADYNIGRMEWKLKKDQGGKPLSTDQKADVARIKAEYDAKMSKLDGEIARLQAEQGKTEELLKGAYAEVKYAEAAAAILAEPGRKASPVRQRMLSWADRMEAEAMASIRARAGRASVGVDPTVLVDMSKLGAAYLTRGVVKLADWTAKMRSVFTDATDADLAKALEMAQAAAEAEKAKAATEERTETREKRKSSQEGKKGDITKEIKALFRDEIEAGVDTLETALANVHAIVIESYPDMTPEQVRDEFSGYGRKFEMNRTETDKIIAQLRREAQLQASLDDVAEGVAPKRSGPQREKPSQRNRELERLLRIRMKEAGIITRDRESQRASALDAIKTRLLNSIADIEKAIATNTRIVADKGIGVEYDAKAQTLKAQRDSLRERYDELFPKEPITDEQRLKIALKQAERLADSWAQREKDARSGKFTGSAAPTSQPWSSALSDLRVKAEASKAEVARLREIAFPKRTAEQVAIDNTKKRYERGIKDMRRRIKDNDFAPRKRPPAVDISKDPEAMKAAVEFALVKLDYEQLREKARLEARSTPEKIKDAALALMDAQRNVLASYDVSAVGRQGWYLALSHPILALRATAAMSLSMTQERSAQIAQSLRERKNWALYKKYDLVVDDDGTGNFSHVEDRFKLKLVESIPGINMSNRAYATFLNVLRADVFDQMLANSRDPSDVSEAKVKALADGINTMSGKGELRFFGKKVDAETAAHFFWAPRFFMSSLDILTFRPLRTGTTETRIAFAKTYARAAVSTALLYTLAGLFRGDDDEPIEWDPRSSDFGAIPFGNHKVGLLGFVRPLLTFAARVLSGQSKSGGEVRNLRASALPFASDAQKIAGVPYGSGMGNTVGRFLQSKAHPTWGVLLSAITGKDFGGGDITVAGVVQDLTMPLALRESLQSVAIDDPNAAAVATILTMFGVSVGPDYQSPEFNRYQAGEKAVSDIVVDKIKGRKREEPSFAARREKLFNKEAAKTLEAATDTSATDGQKATAVKFLGYMGTDAARDALRESKRNAGESVRAWEGNKKTAFGERLGRFSELARMAEAGERPATAPEAKSKLEIGSALWKAANKPDDEGMREIAVRMLSKMKVDEARAAFAAHAKRSGMKPVSWNGDKKTKYGVKKDYLERMIKESGAE